MLKLHAQKPDLSLMKIYVEKKKREASQAATAVAHALVDHLNTGYVVFGLFHVKM
jgi:hypothetical protein